MSGYLGKALARVNQTKPTRFQHIPHQWNELVYGKRVQFATEEDKSEKLNAKGKK